ncbi:YihY/virulence factor BrkB family protein [Kitasatospora sp. NPDC059571]|uniref:YihY/virulence factor BrkB family protein n=1 Tax=Kitasatospora sp. NPDC059571 TaxID=3346871 RepID=UPI0036C229EE
MQAAGSTPRETSGPAAERPSRRRGGRRRAARRSTWRQTGWALLKDTTNTCVEYRVTGLAAEAAFFTLLSIPPLLLCLAGTLGYLDDILGAGTIDKLKQDIVSASGTVLSPDAVQQIVQPVLTGVFDNARPDLISIGFLLSLWSGSRALYIFIDTITVMYGLDGKRGIVKTRLMSLGLYLGALVIGSLVLPLLVAGPGLVVAALPDSAGLVNALYWPAAILLLVIFLTTLYHVAVPANTPWREDIPGALVALVVLVVCSVALRLYLISSVEGSSGGGPSVYGSLAAPVAVLLWIFVMALAVLIGAAMNAAIDRRWPSVETADARAENERASEEAAVVVVREAAARRAVERALLVRELGLAEGGDEEEEEDDGVPPSEYPERWADVLPHRSLRARLSGRRRHRRPPPPPDTDRPLAPPRPSPHHHPQPEPLRPPTRPEPLHPQDFPQVPPVPPAPPRTPWDGRWNG